MIDAGKPLFDSEGLEPHTLSWVHYREAMLRRSMTEYRLERREAEANFIESVWLNEWSGAVRLAMKANERIAVHVLDALWYLRAEDGFYLKGALHDAPNFAQQYAPPHVRALRRAERTSVRATTRPTQRAVFGELPIGARFHDGKSKGIGAKSNVVRWRELIKRTASAAEVVEQHGFEDERDVFGCVNLASDCAVWLLDAPAHELADAAPVAAVANRFGLPEAAVNALLTEQPSALRNRDRYLEPSGSMEPDTACPRFALGTPRIQSGINDELDCYVDFLSEFPARDLVTSEPEAGIRMHPTYSRYVEMLAQGHQPPYINVYEHVQDDGSSKLVAGGRRRTLAAQELDRNIVGWFGRANRETNLPLKYGDVLDAYLDAIDELQLTRRSGPSSVRDPATAVRATLDHHSSVPLP